MGATWVVARTQHDKFRQGGLKRMNFRDGRRPYSGASQTFRRYRS